MTGDNGISELKSSDIVDMVIISPTVGDSGFYLSSLSISDTEISGAVSSEVGLVGDFTVDRLGLEGSAVEIMDPIGVGRGRIVFGRDELFKKMVAGETTFSVDATPIHPGVIVYPAERRIASLLVDGLEYATGRVRLRAGEGIRLITTIEDDKHVVTIHAVGARAEKDCGDGQPIKNINSVDPNEYGTLFVQPGIYATPEDVEALRQLIRVRPDENGIIISLAELDS